MKEDELTQQSTDMTAATLFTKDECDPNKEQEINISSVKTGDTKVVDATDVFLDRLRANKRSFQFSSLTTTASVRNSLKKYHFTSDSYNEHDNSSKTDITDDDITVIGELHGGDNSGPHLAFSVGTTHEEDDCLLEEIEVKYDDEIQKCSNPNRKQKVVEVSLSNLREKRARYQEREKENKEKLLRIFHAKIAPSDNQAAEDELKKVLVKDMFAKVRFLCFHSCLQ